MLTSAPESRAGLSSRKSCSDTCKVLSPAVLSDGLQPVTHPCTLSQQLLDSGVALAVEPCLQTHSLVTAAQWLSVVEICQVDPFDGVFPNSAQIVATFLKVSSCYCAVCAQASYRFYLPVVVRGIVSCKIGVVLNCICAIRLVCLM